MTVTINNSWDCTQREFVVDIAAAIYRTHGHEIQGRDLMYLFRSQHPTERAVLAAAEAIFEMLTGDSPDYASDDEDESDRHD